MKGNNNLVPCNKYNIFISKHFQLLRHWFSFYANLVAAAAASSFVRVVAATFRQPHEAEVAVWAM